MSTKKIDTLYLQGKEQEDPFSFYYIHLRPLLLRYARTIGRQSLAQIDSHLIVEMVDDLLLEIDQFQGKSSFATWAYVRFRRCWIKEYRYVKKNLGTSLDSLQEEWESQHGVNSEGLAGDITSPYESSYEPTLEVNMIIEDMQKLLSPRQLQVMELYRKGFTGKEIAERLDISQQRVDSIWRRVLTIAKKYGSRPVVETGESPTNKVHG